MFHKGWHQACEKLFGVEVPEPEPETIRLRSLLGDRVFEKAVSPLTLSLGVDVHGKPGQTCPRCGGTVSEVKRERRATHFCRTCQPGSMFER